MSHIYHFFPCLSVTEVFSNVATKAYMQSYIFLSNAFVFIDVFCFCILDQDREGA